MFEFTVRGHSADPHNLVVKALFEATVLAARKAIDTSGSVNGEGYSTDPSGTLEFDAANIVDVVGSVAAAKVAVATAQAALDAAAVAKKAADQALADAEKQESSDEPDTTTDGVNASDAAVQLAKDNKIDLTTLTGSGVDGKILVSDVQAAIDAAKTPA